MKKYFLLFVMLWSNALAQTPTVPSIEVTGSASMQVVPDLVEMQIVLGSPKVSKASLDEYEARFFKLLEEHHIPKSAVSFVSQESPYYWYWWWSDRYSHNTTRTYKLHLNTSTMNLKFIKDLDPSYIQQVRIVSTTHSKITEYRQQVKTEAIKAAKNKASYLLESIGQKSGKLLEAVELPEDNGVHNYWRFNENVNFTSNSILPGKYQESHDGEQSLVEPIKLRYEIKTKFEIQ